MQQSTMTEVNVKTVAKPTSHPSYTLLLDRYADAIRRHYAGEVGEEAVAEAKSRLDRFLLGMKEPEPEPEPEPVKIAGYLPRLTPYQKAVAKMAGSEALVTHVAHAEDPSKPEWWNEMKRKQVNRHLNAPFGGSWHRVQGQPKSDLNRINGRRYRAWLKKLDQRCRENPSPTFKVRLKKECLRSVNCRTSKSKGTGKMTPEDVVVQLQLLGVEVEV